MKRYIIVIMFFLTSCVKRAEKINEAPINENIINKNVIVEDKKIEHSIINLDTSVSPVNDSLSEYIMKKKFLYDENDFSINENLNLSELNYYNPIERFEKFKTDSNTFINTLCFKSNYIKKGGLKKIIINLNNNLFPINDVSISYVNGDELAQIDERFKNFKNSHLVKILCNNNDTNMCVFDQNNNLESFAIVQPLKSEENCYELIRILKNIQLIINSNPR